MRKVSFWLVVLLTLSAFAAPAFASPATLVGSWTSTAAFDQTGEESQGLWTFGIDRTLVVSAELAGASAGHGSWKRTGLRTFEAVNSAFTFAPEGSSAFTVKTRATFEVSADGDRFTAAFDSELLAPDGTVLSTTTGTATGQRIKVD